MDKAIFLDRDGVINELVYYPEHGIIDSPFTPGQLKVYPWAGEAIRVFHDYGYKVVLASNQPGMAKESFSQSEFEATRDKMKLELLAQGASLDGEYYCFHYPQAAVEKLRSVCDCRKPLPGLLLRAARELGISLAQSWMIGDGLTDVQTGKSAGCRTVLIGRMKCELCHKMDEVGVRPDMIAPDVRAAAEQIIHGLAMGSIVSTCTSNSERRGEP